MNSMSGKQHLAARVAQAWTQNHGWLLSGASLIVAMVACGLWYLGLVPVLLLSSPTKRPIVSQSIQGQSGILVAQVIADEASKNKAGRILLFTPSNDSNAPPAYQERFTLDERGLASLLLVVPATSYSIIAYIDENENSQLDFDNDGRALESFRLPQAVTVNGIDKNLAGGLIDLPARIPCLCVFNFQSAPAEN